MILKKKLESLQRFKNFVEFLGFRSELFLLKSKLFHGELCFENMKTRDPPYNLLLRKLILKSLDICKETPARYLISGKSGMLLLYANLVSTKALLTLLLLSIVCAGACACAHACVSVRIFTFHFFGVPTIHFYFC